MLVSESAHQQTGQLPSLSLLRSDDNKLEKLNEEIGRNSHSRSERSSETDTEFLSNRLSDYEASDYRYHIESGDDIHKSKRSVSESSVFKTHSESEEDTSSEFNPPSEMQIAQARKLILEEGHEGKSSPSFLQEMDSLDNEPVSSSASFSFRLTNSSFLDSLKNQSLLNRFSKLRRTLDNDEEGLSDTASLSEETRKNGSEMFIEEFLEDEKLLAEIISKKSGFAFRESDIFNDPRARNFADLEESQVTVCCISNFRNKKNC